MMTMRPPSWPLVGLLVASLVVLAVDTNHLPGFPDWFWSHAYGLIAVAVSVWRVTGHRHALLVATSVLFVVSFARATTFAVFEWPERASGVALNVMLALFAMQMMTAHWRWSK